MRVSSLALLTVVATVAIAGDSCSYRNPTINRIVDPYWKKSDFNANNEWYVRTTVVDAPPEAPYISIADGDWLMLEKIRWEITENMLIGWRSYPVVPGSDDDNYPGSEDVYKGEPVAMFRITDHFDIKQDFNPGTGEKGNTIVENHDRLWFDRAYMRVDWSVNLVPTFKFHIWLNQILDTHVVDQHDPGDPKRYRFEDDANGNLDYFEVTTKTQVAPDLYTYFGFYGVPFQYDPAGAVISMRHSFMRVPPSDYQPLPMPPSVVLEDENGNEVRDSKGFAVRVPINDRFGYFGTLGRQTFDQNRGVVEAGQIFNASRFNIWKRHTNDDGSIIPIDQREPKPIIYYMNVEHPEALKNGSHRVEAEWNRAFRSMIAAAQPNKYHGELDADGIPADVPPMFILKENDCSFDNVGKVLDGLPGDIRTEVETAAARQSYNDQVVSFDGTFKDAKARFDHSQDESQGTFTTRSDEENQAKNDLERICSALEYYTQGDPTLGIPAPKDENGKTLQAFKYERLGDTRYSLLDLIVGPFQSGWVGLGPPYSDPITGETISGTANIAVAGLDRMAARAAQYVSILNGEVSPTDFTFGFDIDKYMKEKLVETNGLTSLKPSNTAKARLATYFDALKQRGGGDVMRNAVGEVPPGRADALMDKIKGTTLEQKLITPDDLIALGGVDPLAAADGTQLDDSLMNAVSPLRGGNLLQRHIDNEKRLVNMGMRAMDPPEFVDGLLLGQAIKYRNLSYDERFKKLREDVYVAIAAHEVGHTTGLFHNMAGSSDALNYGTTFWDIQKLPSDLQDALTVLQQKTDQTSIDRAARVQGCIDAVATIGSDQAAQLDPGAATMTTQDCLEQEEATYSSIMDYQANWTTNEESHVLGPYDLAATKFAYAQLLEVFKDGALSSSNDTRPLKRKIFLNGWENIDSDVTLPNGTTAPALMAGSNLDERVANIYNRTYVKMDWNTSSTHQAPLPNEVPYKFGYGAEFTPDEKPFDFGPDFRTNAKNEITRYFQHYFFTHFSRDHLSLYDTGGFFNAVDADIGTMMDFTQKMQWFFFFEATDPDFRGSHAEDDMLAATITGLNLFGKVLGHPANGRYVTAQKSDIFGITNLPPEERTQEPSNIAIPWSNIGSCSGRQVAVTGTLIGTPEPCSVDADCADATKGNPQACGTGAGAHDCVCDASHGQCIDTQNSRDGVFVGPKAGYDATIVPQSEGRPFFLGLTDDYEDWYVTYVGSYWTKQYALALLGYDRAFFPRADFYADPRIYDISWYRLFPKQVGRLFHDLITDQPQELGPLMTPDGQYVSRDLLNPDLSEPDYTGDTEILPSISFNHEYYAALYANFYMGSDTDNTLDLPKTMKIALQGGNDDTSSFDDAIAQAQANGQDPSEVVATFTHPISGLTLRGLKVGDFPIAYDLVNRLNVLKERFLRLDACVNDMHADLADDGIINDPTGAHLTDPYCSCIDNYTDPLTGNCTQQVVESLAAGPDGVNHTQCQPFVLENRRESAREIMDDLVDYVGDLRSLNKILGWY